MKIALYIEDGLEQIVLTPESDTEKSILQKLHDGSRKFELAKGSFYECRGGWMRHRQHFVSDAYGLQREVNDESTMIVMRAIQPEEKTEAASQ